MPDNYLAVANNVIYNQDGLVAKRPGNELYSGYGHTGSNAAIFSMTRFYFGTPPIGQLVAHSGTGLYAGNDGTGHFTLINNSMGANGATFDQLYDPDFTPGAADVLFVCDGSRTAELRRHELRAGSDGRGLAAARAQRLSPITPKYVCVWGTHLVYSGEPSEPGGVYISTMRCVRKSSPASRVRRFGRHAVHRISPTRATASWAKSPASFRSARI